MKRADRDEGLEIREKAGGRIASPWRAKAGSIKQTKIIYQDTKRGKVPIQRDRLEKRGLLK
jgi:hypothetical protein